jgi:Fe/S biogenesis protein NfuA
MTIDADRPEADVADLTGPDSDAADGTSAGEVVMSVTDDAMGTVLGIRAEEDRPESLGLRVEVTGMKGPEYTYDLSFEELDGLDPDHVRYQVGELTVVIPTGSVENLRGAELDLPRNAGQGGLVIRNPNRPDPLAGISVELTGDVAERVTQLLEQSINPALASHGGYATLVGVDEDNKVYVTMGGGCQGCSASAATLSEGIKRSILEHVPDVTDVVDATDHAAGENPFYS